MSEHTDGVYNAVSALRSADVERQRIEVALRLNATALAELLMTRLHHVDGEMLRGLKSALQEFDAARRKWKGER